MTFDFLKFTIVEKYAYSWWHKMRKSKILKTTLNFKIWNIQNGPSKDMYVSMHINLISEYEHSILF